VAAATTLSDPFIRRPAMLAAMVRPGRRHPFSALETTLRDGLTILPDAFDRGATAPRAVHLARAADQRAAALAVGYVRGLTPVRRTTLAVAGAGSGRPVDEQAADAADDVDVAPVFIIEAMLRVVAPAGDEVTLEELVELVGQLRDGGVPIVW